MCWCPLAAAMGRNRQGIALRSLSPIHNWGTWLVVGWQFLPSTEDTLQGKGIASLFYWKGQAVGQVQHPSPRPDMQHPHAEQSQRLGQGRACEGGSGAGPLATPQHPATRFRPWALLSPPGQGDRGLACCLPAEALPAASRQHCVGTALPTGRVGPSGWRCLRKRSPTSPLHGFPSPFWKGCAELGPGPPPRCGDLSVKGPSLSTRSALVRQC